MTGCRCFALDAGSQVDKNRTGLLGVRLVVCSGVCFFRHSAASMSEKSGPDARCPSRVRQKEVVG